jgi:hypothetical protein
MKHAAVRLRLLILSACVAIIACSEPLEFADWTIPVPEGVQVHEYAPVPIEERREWIELDAEVVATDQGADAPFEVPVDLAVDQAGLLYVLDARAR